MKRQRVFADKPKLGSVEWQRQVIREEAREKINKQKKNGKYVSHS